MIRRAKHIPLKWLDWRQAKLTRAKNIKDTEMLVNKKVGSVETKSP